MDMETSQPGQSNSMWVCRVREALGTGLGVEDIAVEMDCSPDDIRAEVEIYRSEGTLRRILGVEKSR